jgi:hypothetical protein
MTQIGPESFVVHDASDCFSDRRHVFGIHERSGVADDFWVGRPVGADDWTAACHGLQQRQSKALEERR